MINIHAFGKTMLAATKHDFMQSCLRLSILVLRRVKLIFTVFVVLNVATAHADPLNTANYQVLVVPGAIKTTESNNQSEGLLTGQQISTLMLSLQNQLVLSQLNVSISQNKAFACQQAFCGRQSLNQLIEDLVTTKNEVSLLVVFDIDDISGVTIQALDPLNSVILNSIQLPYIGIDAQSSPSFTQVFRTFEDASALLVKDLVDNRRVFNFSFLLKGYSQSEISDIFELLKSIDNAPNQVQLVTIRTKLSTIAQLARWRTYESTFTVATFSTATQVWQTLQNATQQYAVDSSLLFYQEQSGGNQHFDFVIERTAPAFMLEKLAALMLVLLLLYGLFTLCVGVLFKNRMTKHLANNHLQQWLRRYQAWHALPVFMPKTIHHAADEYAQKVMLSEELLLTAQTLFDKSDILSAKATLQRAKSLTAGNPKALAMERMFSDFYSKQLKGQDSLSTMKHSLQKAVGCLKLGNTSQAYYYAYAAKQCCEDTQYQEHAAIDKLINKIHDAVALDADKQSDRNNQHLHIVHDSDGSQVSTRISCATQCRIGRSVNNNVDLDTNRATNALSAKQQQFGSVVANVHPIAEADDEAVRQIESVSGLNSAQVNIASKFDISIQHASVSRLGKQNLISWEHDTFVIQDQGSGNGSWLNHKQLSSNIAITLNQGNLLTLADADNMSPLRFLIDVDNSQQSLSFSFHHSIDSMHDLSALQDTWSNIKGMRNQQSWLVGKGIYLCVSQLDKDMQQLFWCHLHQISNDDIVLGQLTFANRWYFSPSVSIITQQSMHINDVIIMGQICLNNNDVLRIGQRSVRVTFDVASEGQ